MRRLGGQFFAPENPNVMNAADGFKSFLQNIATQTGVSYAPASTAQESLQNFLTALALREQQATPAPVAQQTPQFAVASQPVYNAPQVSAPATVAPPAKNPLTFWATVATVLLTLSGKG